jgi:hypothetical protein
MFGYSLLKVQASFIGAPLLGYPVSYVSLNLIMFDAFMQMYELRVGLLYSIEAISVFKILLQD